MDFVENQRMDVVPFITITTGEVKNAIRVKEPSNMMDLHRANVLQEAIPPNRDLS